MGSPNGIGLKIIIIIAIITVNSLGVLYLARQFFGFTVPRGQSKFVEDEQPPKQFQNCLAKTPAN